MNYNEFENCPLNRFLKMLTGKWKPLLMYQFFHHGDIRFTELWRNMPRVSKKVLLEQLKEMEADGLVQRIQINTFPVEVFYGLTDYGKSMLPLIEHIEKWVNGK